MKSSIEKTLSISIAVAFGVVAFLSGGIVKSSFAKDTDVYYTCPMPEHADVISDKPGKCPKCGMDLVAKKKEVSAKYTCPMPEHADVISDKPGKCPKCGMDLVPMKAEEKL